MKKFIFTLQRLYDVKQSEEKQKRLELEELEKNLRNYEKQRDANQALFKKQYNSYEKKCREGMEAREVKQYGEFFQYLEKEIRMQETVIASCRQSIESCRTALLKLINEENVLDRMKDEQYQDYMKDVQKDQDKLIEDFMQARL